MTGFSHLPKGTNTTWRSAAEFDAVLERVKQAGLDFSADPLHERVNEINHLEGGRGFYFHERKRPQVEILARP